MKIKNFFAVFFLLTIVSCSDDPAPAPEPIDLSGYHISFLFDGDLKQLVLSEGNILDYTGTGGLPDMFDPEDDSTFGDYHGGFSTIDESFVLSLARRIKYRNGDYVDDPQGSMDSWFAVGSHSYSVGYDDQGFDIGFKDGENSYHSQHGSQSGSSFTITEISPIDLDVHPELVAKGNFNCKLYQEGSTAAHEVTDGTFHVRFAL